MYKINLLLVIVGLAILSGGNVYAEDWKVGEKWTYKHEGPRPFADPSAKIQGDRMVGRPGHVPGLVIRTFLG